MQKFALVTIAAALCALPALSQTGAQVAAAPVAQPTLGAAFPQKGDLLIEGLGGVNSSAVDRDVVPTTSASAGVQVGYGIGHKMAFTGTYLFDQIGKTGGVSVNAKEFEIGLTRAFTQKGRIEPYARLDVGGMHQDSRIQNGKITNGDTQVVVAPGAGFLLVINRVFAFDFGVRAVVPAWSHPLPWQAQGLFGVVFRVPARR